MKRLIYTIALLLFVISIFPRCAKIVAPQGGDKDTIAPVLVKSNPGINATNVKTQKITLSFDEYVQLKDMQKQLVVSPPMVKKPEVLLRGKNVEIRLRDTLKENKTYTFYFRDAIVDNNEGNPLKNFEFVFSTGNSIDSLTLTGIVTNSFTLIPEEGVMVMLYENQNDSVPYKELPLHVASTNKYGIFNFKNLSNNDFKIIALKDGNSNYKIDGTNEDIAFSDSIVKKGVLKYPSKMDTSRLGIKDVNLVMFKEKVRVQTITDYSRKKRERFTLSFSKKPEGEMLLEPLGVDVDKNWYIKETGQKEDSLVYWITNEKISQIDSLKLKISYLKTDSLEHLKPQIDTIRLTYVDSEIQQIRKKSKDKKQEKKAPLGVKCNIANGQVAKPVNDFILTFPTPLKSRNDSLISFMNLKDSSKLEGFKLTQDSLIQRIYHFHYAWVSDNTYEFTAMPGAFKAIDGLESDTIKIKIKGANPENFGTLSIDIKNIKKSAIVELLDEKGTIIVDRRIVSSDGKVTFTFVDAGKYTVRFIEDSNKNGVWDTGWYLGKIQPEKVFKFSEGKNKGVINVRANWDNDISFEFPK